MTRGKHGQSAAARHAIEKATSTVETYQAAVRRLTAENRDLRAKLVQQSTTSSQEVRRLKAERDEGVAPTLSVVQRQLTKAQEELRRNQADFREVVKQWTNLKKRVRHHFLVEHHMPVPQAMGKLLNMLVDEDVTTDNDFVITYERVVPRRGQSKEETREMALRIARAHGDRR